jgi:hypothetical protein
MAYIDLIQHKPRTRLNRQGSNQYRTKRKRNIVLAQFERYEGYPRFIKGKTWLSILIIILIIGILEAFVYAFKAQALTTQMWQESLAYNVMPHQFKPEKVELAPLSEREANMALIKKIWGKDADTGLAIAKCESGYRTKAQNYNTNGTIDEGVFQVNSIHGMPEMFNAVANISYAYTKFIEQGTTPWDSSAHCWKGSL